ncbi:MAG: MBL fold metallo-hydrolase [Desertimonas sp.]
MTTVDWGDDELRLTDRVSVLRGMTNGQYPSGNSIVVRGDGETVIIDPSVSVVDRGGAPLPVDAVLNSHGHEDHVAGNGLFASARVHIHDDDVHAARSLEGLMAIYGYDPDTSATLAAHIVEDFHYVARPDAIGFGDGHVWDLGGTTVEAVHLPGHTRGHSGFRIDGGRVFFLADIDLTGFGPYYGDAWSDLDQFEESLVKVRDEQADHYVTFHHKGVVEGRDHFVELLDDFHAVIGRRHEAMLEFLTEPHTLGEIVAHRFVYRPHVDLPFADAVERRTAQLHLQRMRDRGEVVEVDPGRVRRR